LGHDSPARVPHTAASKRARESDIRLVADPAGPHRSTGLISGGTLLGRRERDQGYADDDEGQNTPQFVT
jgi:hypothetical protein